MRRFTIRAVWCATLLGAVSGSLSALGQEKSTAPTEKNSDTLLWVARSNEYAKALLKPVAQFAPEFAGQLGVDGLDQEIKDLKPGVDQRFQDSLKKAIQELQARLADEKHPAVRQDLEISIDAANRFLEGEQLEEKYDIPIHNVPEAVFMGVRTLLDDQIPEDRRKAALVRLNRYAGVESGYMPLTNLAMDRTRERLNQPGLMGPPKIEVEKGLANAPRYIEGIKQLFEKFAIKGYEPAYEKLKKQLDEYDAFVRKEVLPKARVDFRQPAEKYAYSLKMSGIDMPVSELVSRAHVAFTEIQREMQALAPLVAKEKGYSCTDYRDVIRELKKDQLVGEKILPHYQQRIKDLEEIIRREHIVTLPQREMRIRLASEAESASIPAPNMRPPRMIGNTGEMGEFVLPLRIPSTDGKGEMTPDDFTFAASSWTLTAHEGRPGHELQFAAMIEGGVSIPRALYAMNSVNVEGWALYAEWEMKPYMPLDGQLICLQERLLRAARAFLDPGLQLGQITEEEATRVLTKDVCMSDAMAMQEVQRYTFWAPGQAPSYFCGYSRLLELRSEVEFTLGPAFDRQKFNDCVIAQGALPPRLLHKAVFEALVPKSQAVSTTTN
ncbi:MAG: DUF885 domain-containing protein [Planctomycetes bacterium]|nr:DUF885 domain-containing protein [Planctomycetota bacterium]MBI3833092.1 DUF885 domain-containing protein [Planctomycetota bacterium]